MIPFEPTRQAAQARLSTVDPTAYARTRNAINGAVTRLSPYLTHGVLSLREVYAAVHARHLLDAKHKFVFELGWRAYWRHVWSHLGDGIHRSIHTGLLPDDAYQPDMPADVIEARTGVAAIDLAVRELYATGYLHNHARMWLASYVVHLRKVHWHAGAQWMLGHLLDGDLASNHLSWQWVAGTGSSKPYLFNADNVGKYAPAQWHSPGTSIDTSYEAMDALARRVEPIDTRFDQRKVGAGVAQPTLYAGPGGDGANQGRSGNPWIAPEQAGLHVMHQDVVLVHPWSLGAWAAEQNAPLPQTLGAINSQTRSNILTIAVGLDASHAPSPWSERRWDFATRGLQEQTRHLWWGNPEQLAAALQTAKSVQWQADPHADTALAALKNQLQNTAPHCRVQSHTLPCLFEPVDVYCRSFSEWWKRTRIAK